MKRWVTQIVQEMGIDAVQKAKYDVAKIATKMGYQPLSIFYYDDSGESDAGLLARIDGITAAVKTGDIVVYQYPSKWFGHRFDMTFIRRMKEKNIKVVLFIHDLDSFTGGAGTTIDEEVQALNASDVAITHGKNMNDWLNTQGVTIPLVEKQLFDFLLPTEMNLEEIIYRKINFAGALFKSPFLQTWNGETVINAYGVRGEMIFPENVNYQGEFSQTALIRNIAKDAFGLSWAENVGGIRHHEYQRMNNPLKVSMYLSIGLPVIVWDEAAVAPVLLENHAGITISNLDEIDRKLENLTDDEIHELKKQANKMSVLVQNGYFTRTSLMEAEKIVFEQEL